MGGAGQGARAVVGTRRVTASSRSGLVGGRRVKTTAPRAAFAPGAIDHVPSDMPGATGPRKAHRAVSSAGGGAADAGALVAVRPRAGQGQTPRGGAPGEQHAQEAVAARAAARATIAPRARGERRRAGREGGGARWLAGGREGRCGERKGEGWAEDGSDGVRGEVAVRRLAGEGGRKAEVLAEDGSDAGGGRSVRGDLARGTGRGAGGEGRRETGRAAGKLGRKVARGAERAEAADAMSFWRRRWTRARRNRREKGRERGDGKRDRRGGGGRSRTVAKAR